MRRSLLISISLAALLIAGGASAEDASDTPLAPAASSTAADSGDTLEWDQFDDPTFDPAAPDDATAPAAADPVADTTPPAAADPLADTTTPGAAAAAGESMSPEALSAVADTAADVDVWAMPSADESGEAAAPTTIGGVVLGPIGIDDEGRTGRLHTVARGDTLWDLSAAYLGTPWVWPSVWIDNGDIANPHLILPGDKIWITANEMRVVSDAEAESFLEAPVAEETVAVVEEPALDDTAFAAEEEAPPLAAFDDAEDDASSLDAFPVAIEADEPTAMTSGRQITIARRDSYGFVSEDALAGASSIVDSSSPRTFLSTGDPVFVGLGEGDTEVDEEYMIFEVLGEVRDVETNRLLGHHVENLGWLEIKQLTGDTSIGEIRQSYSEIRRGARVMLREQLPRRVTLRTTPDAIEGQVVYLPSDRTLAADGEYVYLNRGEFHGLEVGTELEVFASGKIMNERERRVDVRTPDTPLATLVVVTVEAESAVAFVLSADREIAVGDDVRPVVDRTLAQR